MDRGSDTEAVRELSRTAGIGRRWGDELLDELDDAVRRVAWHGPIAEEFRAQWDEVLAQARSTFADMERRGAQLTEQALAQDLASAAEELLSDLEPQAG